MSWLNTLFENSKKSGRMICLIFVLGTACALSILLAHKDPGMINSILEKWLTILGMLTAFYLASPKPAEV